MCNASTIARPPAELRPSWLPLAWLRIVGDRLGWPAALDPLGRWALAAALFLLALALQLDVETAGRPYPFLAFFPAVLVCAWLCGRAPALAVTAASATASWWFLIRPPGTLGWPTGVQAAALALFGATGSLAAALIAGLARRAVRAHQAQLRAEADLAAQAVLSAELQHRFANNLQVVASTLTLQARRLRDTPAAAALHDATRRLEVLGRLHRLLLTGGGGGQAGQVLAELCRMQVEASGDGRVALDVDIDPALTLDPDRLTLVGMILSEAISNALKHGFADGGSGRIAVRLRAIASARLQLEVRDTGAGLPRSFDLNRAHALGLRIVQSMTRQLGGTLSLSSDRGTVLRVVFPAVRA